MILIQILKFSKTIVYALVVISINLALDKYTEGSTARAADTENTLKIATIQFTSEWNPISHSSFPATLVTALTTERLFEPVCFGQGVKANDSYMPVCQNPAVQIGRGGVNLNIVGCRANGAQLNASDVQYTVEQISRVMHNSHSLYDLKIQKGRLLIEGGAADWYINHAFSFPVLRRGPEKLFLMRISTGKSGDQIINTYNNVTAGNYRLEEIHSDTVKLSLRPGSTTAEKPNVSKINLLIYDRMQDLARDMVQDNPPHVVLNLGKTTTKNRYNKRHSPDLTSFTYIGFNYKTDDAVKRRLFIDKHFRELFTKSLWHIEEIGNFVKASGIGTFLGESFESGQHITVIDPSSKSDIKRSIQTYLEKRSWSGTLKLKIIVPPDVGEIFDEADLKNITIGLNDQWKTVEEDRNIDFTITPSVTPAIFDRLKKRKKYDLVLDTFYFGQNKLKYMAFLHPKSQINELQFEGIPIAEIDRFIQDVDTQGFLDRVRDTYPVAVIGRLDRRHFFLKELRTAIPPDPPCKSETIVEPFYNVKMWEVRVDKEY